MILKFYFTSAILLVCSEFIYAIEGGYGDSFDNSDGFTAIYGKPKKTGSLGLSVGVHFEHVPIKYYGRKPYDNSKIILKLGDSDGYNHHNHGYGKDHGYEKDHGYVNGYDDSHVEMGCVGLGCDDNASGYGYGGAYGGSEPPKYYSKFPSFKSLSGRHLMKHSSIEPASSANYAKKLNYKKSFRPNENYNHLFEQIVSKIDSQPQKKIFPSPVAKYHNGAFRSSDAHHSISRYFEPKKRSGSQKIEKYLHLKNRRQNLSPVGLAFATPHDFSKYAKLVDD